ncbi:MAG TPA: hypothetical protein VH138_15545 [Vicinamibacterales bacterium]|jgi:hypothetical protein|nr:hypothetical protein [Vicinamibacterales bacterium]
MLIDRSHTPWAVASVATLVVAAVAYVPYALGSSPPSGGTAMGLAYGTVGFGFMAFVTLLSVRKKFPIWRIGRTQTWMRGHLWLGAISFPLIVLHAGFAFGHGLTSWLMWLFVSVWTSGLVGAWLQHVVPRRLLRDVPMETIYEQIGRVREQLVDEADTVVADACGRLEVVTEVSASPDAALGTAGLATVMRPVDPSADDTGALREFYVTEMRPFLEKPTRSHVLADPTSASDRFAQLRLLVPPFAPAIADLENICEEVRQLRRQVTIHGLLHGWLLVHVPLSFALMALAVVHIVMALKY